MAERKICKIKNDIIKHNQNPEDYHTKLETHVKTIRESMSLDIKDGIISITHLIIFTIAISIFVILLQCTDSQNLECSIFRFILTFPYSLFLFLFCFYILFFIIPNIIKLFRCLFSTRKYDLDEYHNWYITQEKDIIIDWWDAKTPIFGKIKYLKCSICGAKKIEKTE
ncbi:hypothetical protein [Methanosarcina sp. MTP4]|uniref:hypothetical protein n=1 Tax=Methanosarcina sp. MTP4 TaxID=1434100 RepID=UPI0018CDA8D0|nr:hypothetical protein [Methanosarcina sp. MTP4]